LINNYSNIIKYSNFKYLVKIEEGFENVVKAITEILKSNLKNTEIIAIMDTEEEDKALNKLKEEVDKLKNYGFEIEEKEEKIRSYLLRLIFKKKKDLRVKVLLFKPSLEKVLVDKGFPDLHSVEEKEKRKIIKEFIKKERFGCDL
jgi:hypothetical protein